MRMVILVLSALALFSSPALAHHPTQHQERVVTVRRAVPNPWGAVSGNFDSAAVRRYISAQIAHEVEHANVLAAYGKMRRVPRPVKQALRAMNREARQARAALRRVQRVYGRNYGRNGRARGGILGRVFHGERCLTSAAELRAVLQYERIRVGLR